MKLFCKCAGMKKSGMTLLELTVVILVLLSLISILFIGARAWKRGSDRSACLMNAVNVQKAVRGYQNMNQLSEGAPLTHIGTIVGPGLMLEQEPICPEYGAYLWQDTIPARGTTYIDCWDPDNSANYHYPQNSSDW